MNYFTRLLVLQRSDTGTMTIFLCYEHGEDYNRALLPSQHSFFFRTPEIKEEKKTDERMMKIPGHWHPAAPSEAVE